MQQLPVVQRIDAMLRPSIEDMGYDLVRVQLSANRGKQTLQLMAEPTGGVRDMAVEDCEKISRHVSAMLDVEDPLAGKYDLEVSSPGIDRPLMREEDFAEYIGHEAKVEMAWPVEGRKRFKGVIQAAEAGKVRLQLDAQNIFDLEMDGMASAKLALTDALIEAHLEKRKTHVNSEEE